MPATAKTLTATEDLPPTEDELMHADGRLVSEADYWAYYYELSDVHYEWNNGRLEEKPVSDNLTYWIYDWLRALLNEFLKTHPIAKCTALEHGFRLALPDRIVIRKPDLAVVRNDNPVPLGDLDCSYRGIFDLCIEALSDTSRGAVERDTVEKRQDYAEIGVREYYIVHHGPDRLMFLSRDPDDSFQSILGADGIVRSRTLPGFQFRIRDLLGRTSIADLRHDPVYRAFVHPAWQQEEEARQQAELERQQAQQAQQQAELDRRAEQQARQATEQTLREAKQQRDAAVVKLRDLGLDPEQIGAVLGLDPESVRGIIDGR